MAGWVAVELARIIDISISSRLVGWLVGWSLMSLSAQIRLYQRQSISSKHITNAGG